MLGLALSALGLGGLGAAAFLYPPFGALLLTAARAAFSWLSRQSPATLLCLVLCLALAIDHIALLSAHRQNRKLERQVVLLSGELQKISAAKNKQQVVTKATVKVVTKLVHDADGRAKVVEDAPVVAGCKTKPEVLQADL